MIEPELKAARERIAELERALSMITAVWPHDRPHRKMGRIEFRRVFNDVNCSPWKKIPDLFSDLFQDLHEYLSYEYGEDPNLRLVGLGDAELWQDKYNQQYRGAVECEACEGGGWVLSSYQASGAPNMQLCTDCYNPLGIAHP